VTEEFMSIHADATIDRYANLIVGVVEGQVCKRDQDKANIAKQHERDGTFGSIIPYAEPAWYRGWASPYYNDSHRRLRAAVREFVDKEMMPYVHQWDEQRSFPREVHRKMAKAGLLPGFIGGAWPEKYVGNHIAGGVKPSEWDAFHELIITDELSRTASCGAIWGVMEGLQIGLPPLIHFTGKSSNKAYFDKVCTECLTGEKVICLAITEPYVGSDVASLQCTATLTEDGKHFRVNGEKKWITNGTFADYFTVAVRTGGPGMKGISMLLVERSRGGVTTSQMKCGGTWSSGTAYITFDNTLVPVENLIGDLNDGFKCVMYNFNHERLGVVTQATRLARVCVEESFRWGMKRKTFGKPLVEHPVIRAKLGDMTRQVESLQAQLELVVHQVNSMTYDQQVRRLGGPIALLKAQATRTFEYCAREAVQIFGGSGYTRTGQGQKIERLYREVRAYAIPAGSEEIMIDLGVRSALKPAKL
jgi:alkylation response protein AidB-like acyl-CoA dehydrogenase